MITILIMIIMKTILITNNTNKVIGKYCYSVWKCCVCVI